MHQPAPLETMKKNLTVLVIGDIPMLLRDIQPALQEQNIRVIVASDGLHAFSLIADEAPACVVLNEKLSRQDGYHVCQMMRRNLQFRELPILLLREKKGRFDQIRARLAGVTESLTLPTSRDEFMNVVKKYL